MKELVSDIIKRYALVLHTAGFKENVVDTWNKTRNPDSFIEKIQPLLKRYEEDPHIDSLIRELKRDVFEGTDNQMELLYKMRKLEVVPVRERTKFSSDMDILRNYLSGIPALLDSETPEVIKTSVNKILRQTQDDGALKKIHDNVKDSIQSLKNPKRKKMLQCLVLKPLQVALGKITPMEIDAVKRNQFKQDLKKITRDKDIQKQYSEKLMQETKTKGAPGSQIQPHTQRLYSNELKKIAYLLIRSLQRANAPS